MRPLYIAALFGAATALQLAPTTRLVPVAFAPPRRVGRIVAGSDDTEPAKIDSKLVNVGDRLLCRDEESNAWWSAAIRDIRGSELLITFMGCDDAWDTWMDASSPDLSLMDAVDIKKEESAFQSGEQRESSRLPPTITLPLSCIDDAPADAPCLPMRCPLAMRRHL